MARVKVIALFAGLALIVGLLALMTPRPPTGPELARLIAETPVTWQNYSEDIKAIGAMPAAQWQGEPVAARADGGALRVVFAIAGPWALRDMAMPVLARDPLGGTHRNTGAECEGARVTYVFAFPGPGDAPPAWIELKFPHGQRRIVLDADGAWAANAP